MIDIQNHLRNEGLLNLFDGRSVAPEPVRHVWSVDEICEVCGITAQAMIESGPCFCPGPNAPET